ncbi:hypothetical protein KM043_007440 [Ampulex compressa]|nr:hypothetical protein KM043_007440 [Ampulex compressa]
MGEGRNDRSGKRQRSAYGIDKSASDSELAQAKGKGRKVKGKKRWPLIEGLTVDELARYRRRRVEGQPKDSLGVCLESNGKNLVTEYRTAFRASSEDLLKKSGRPEDFPRLEAFDENVGAPYRENFKDFEKTGLPAKNRGPAGSFVLADVDATMQTETESSRFIAHVNPPGRPSLIRRGTSLKREGDFSKDTESYSSYVAHEGDHRAELARRATSLKMEGDLEAVTEKCEKFIRWLNVSRPELTRIPTNLKLEGELEISTENQEKYVPFVGTRRPELLRQSTNLKLEGESTFLPEYADVFRDHRIKERTTWRKPENHLKTGRDFFQTTESTENFVNPRVKEAQLMSELNKDVEKEEQEQEEEEEEERKRRERFEKEMRDEEMKMLVSKLEDLQGPPLEVPEYRDAYKDFPRERPKILKPEDEIGRADGSKVPSSPTHSKFSTKIDQDPEYKSKYLDYPRERPVYRKPPASLRPTLVPSGRSSAGLSKSLRQDFRRQDYEATSEVRAQYVPYGHVPRVETLKMPASLRLEGNLDLEPEYRNAYCTKHDNRPCDEPRMHRGRDRSSSASRRRENYWMNNDHSERFGRVNAAQDQEAFQVLNTRIHEESVVGKPPPASRRGSRVSQIQVQRPAQVSRNRSPSPTYRLHVCNVDDEPRGFGRPRGRSSFQSSGRIRTPSADRAAREVLDRPPYSPSFGKDPRQPDGHSFVVLDNRTNGQEKNEARRRRLDKNCNIDNLRRSSRGRPRTPTNWMPPWGDYNRR